MFYFLTLRVPFAFVFYMCEPGNAKQVQKVKRKTWIAHAYLTLLLFTLNEWILFVSAFALAFALALGLHVKTMLACTAGVERSLGDQKGGKMGRGLGSRLKPRFSFQPWVSPWYACGTHRCIKTPKARAGLSLAKARPKSFAKVQQHQGS